MSKILLQLHQLFPHYTVFSPTIMVERPSLSRKDRTLLRYVEGYKKIERERERRRKNIL